MGLICGRSKMPDNYVYPRDYLEINRLNLHHYLLRETFGYLLHPSIPTDKPSLSVADVGTGTGIWLVDLSHKLPSDARLDGFDISFGSASPQQWLPKNMTLREWDVHTEVPEDLVGVYDIVRVSLLVFVIRDEDLSAVVGRLLKLLKPGGHLQWYETDISSFRFKKLSPENKTEALTNLLTVVVSGDSRLSPTWTNRLPDVFRENGLSAIECDIKDPPPELVMPLHQCNLVIHENLARRILDPQRAEAIKNAIPDAIKESDAGAALDWTRVIVVGKKPLQ